MDKTVTDQGTGNCNKDLPFDWNVEVCDVMQAKVDQSLQVVLAEMLVKRLLLDSFTLLVGIETILCEAPHG